MKTDKQEGKKSTKLIKIDDKNYINPEKIIAINLPLSTTCSQYWLTIILEDKIKLQLHFNSREQGEQWIKELMSDE